MTPQIVLHIGSPKCGSTYLQQVMLRNRDRLLEQGIHYPMPPAAHPGNAAGLRSLDAQQLADMFRPGTHTVVLSHEDLYARAADGAGLAAWAQARGISVQVIAFLRPFSEFMFGDYSQFMKQHFESYLKRRNPYDGLDFEGFTRRRAETIRPAHYLTNWARLFPRHPIRIESHRDIRPVLESLLPAPTQIDWTINRNLTNPSLRMEDCDRIAEAMRDRQTDPAPIRVMLREAFHRVGEHDSGKSDDRIAYAEAAFSAQNSALLEAFGYDNRRV